MVKIPSTLAWIAGIGFFILVLPLAGLVIFQEKVIFYPSILEKEYKFNFASEYQEKSFRLDEDKIHSLLFKSPNSKGTILFFHGNAGSLDSWGYVAEKLTQELSWNVWIVDYPGYGKSEGSIKSEEQLLEMASHLYSEARKEFGPDHKLISWGRSIGSGIAASLASENIVTALILETPYYNFRELVSQKAPWAPSAFLRYSFPLNKWIGKTKSPILIFHGTNDGVIPYSHSQRLSEEFKEAQLVTVTNAAHNNLDEYEVYWLALSGFFSKL